MIMLEELYELSKQQIKWRIGYDGMGKSKLSRGALLFVKRYNKQKGRLEVTQRSCDKGYRKA